MAHTLPSDLLISLPEGFHLYGFLSTGLAAQLVHGNPGRCTFLVPSEALGEMPADLRSAARWQEFPHHRLSLLEETYPWGAEYVGHILRALPDHFVLVRSHPQDSTNGYRAIEDHPRVRIFHPGVPGKNLPRILGFWLPQRDEAYNLAEQIFFAESIVTAYSTVTLDTLFLNRPAINIAFDGCNSVFIISMREYYETDHYRHLSRSGAVPLVDSPAELAEVLNTVDQWWPNRASQVRAFEKSVRSLC